MTPTAALLESATLVRQGAEAVRLIIYNFTILTVKLIRQKVYKAYLHGSQTSGGVEANGEPILLKYRFNKQYRHPSLNTTLTRQRIAQEVRSLMKCLR